MTTELRICASCDAPDHAENCPLCLGWGFTFDNHIISASMLHRWQENKMRLYKRCAFCAGTPFGRQPS